MFSLYIIISHKKLLKKSNSIKEDELITSFLPVIEKRGGVVSEYGSYLTLFPSKYDYSRVSFIKCLQELYEIFSNNSELIGFSLIVDDFQPTSEYEYLNIKNKLCLSTNKIEKIWFTDNTYKKFENLFTGKKYKNLVMVTNSFFKLDLQEENVSATLVDTQCQKQLNLINDSVSYLNSSINVNIYRNIVYWAKNNRVQKILYIDFGMSADKILTFIDYLISLKDTFDPNYDLTDYEKKEWGNYLDLFNKFYIRSSDCFILDDSLIHFNKLILLWIESFAKKYSVLFIIKVDDEDLKDLWQLISLIYNVNLLIFNKNIPDVQTTFSLPTLLGLDSCLGVSLQDYLDNKNSVSLMVLYFVLLTQGFILKTDIIKIIKNLNYNELIIKEEINNYIRDGLLLGDKHLYPGCDSILELIVSIKSSKIEEWKNNFLSSFLELKYDKVFSYSYIFCLIGIDSFFKKEALNVLFFFIQNVLDLGRHTTLSLDLIDESFNNSSLRNILEYKKVRENRLLGVISDIKFIETLNGNPKFEMSLEFLDILNIWSTHRDANLLNRSKELYYSYQSKSEPFSESRAKIIFALSLLSICRVSESVDYFELNCSFSKNISDTYSYIRNGCFLSMALFIKGDISGVLRVTEQFLKHNWIYFKTRWLLYLKFLRARALNELGQYDSALELLESGVLLAEDFDYKDILIVFNNWKGRTLNYATKTKEAREFLLSNIQNSESFFFLAEIEYFSGNKITALEYIEQAVFEVDDKVLFDENIKWRDGYFVIEEFFDRDRENSVLKQEIFNFYYFLKIINGSHSALKNYRNKILKISNSSLGIYDYKYLFYLYIASENADEDEEINRENIFNKIIRLLQQRTSNISEHNQKHHYLNNFFNGYIMEESDRKKVF